MKHTKTQDYHRWPEGAVVYQVYPRSFYDTNSDGIGDIPGITAKLDYLKELGVNAIWISPFYPSPMADFGYDVADYCSVDPIFGTLKDFETMLAAAHKRGIKVLIDLVPNHTSDDHPWFRQSRQSPEDPYSDWYIWKGPKGFDEGGKPIPPNNWIEVLTGGPAWQWEPARQQFYLHSFDVRQPDLNWSNPNVREAIKAAMRFWLDKGVDGFRVDAVQFMAKDPLFRDEPVNPHYNGRGMKYAKLQHPHNHGWPPMYAYLAEMAAVLKEPKYSHSPRFMITEAYPDTHNPVEEYLTFYEGVDPEVAAPFNFEGLSMDWDAHTWHTFLHKFHAALDASGPHSIASYAFGNHDQHRIVTRLGEHAARSAAVLLLTLPGMVFIYNGDELGMTNGEIPPEYVQDPGARGGSGRDPERTPMQWGAGKNAGFTSAVRPWLPLADNFQTHNAETEASDPTSFLSLYRKLGNLRNSSDILKHGRLEVLNSGSSHVLAYKREHKGKSIVTLVNFSNKTVKCKPEIALGELLASSHPEPLHAPGSEHAQLHPHEAVVITAK